MKKEANFIDGVLKEFYYKALDKNIISEEGLSKTASVSIDKYAATGNLMQDLVNLASGLRELGLFEQAESLETKINIFKQAQSAVSNLIDQESQALLNKAHPSSTKITDAQNGWGVVHTNLDRQNKILQTLLKKNEPAPAVVQNTALAAAEALGLLKSGQENNKKKLKNNILKYSGTARVTYQVGSGTAVGNFKTVTNSDGDTIINDPEFPQMGIILKKEDIQKDPVPDKLIEPKPAAPAPGKPAAPAPGKPAAPAPGKPAAPAPGKPAAAAAQAPKQENEIAKMQRLLQEFADFYIQHPETDKDDTGKTMFTKQDLATIMSVGPTARKGDVDGVWGQRTSNSIKKIADKTFLQLERGPSNDENLAKKNSQILKSFLIMRNWKPATEGSQEALDYIIPANIASKNDKYDMDQARRLGAIPLYESNLSSLNSFYSYFKNELQEKVDKIKISSWIYRFQYFIERAKYLLNLKNTDLEAGKNSQKYLSLSNALLQYFLKFLKNQYPQIKNIQDYKDYTIPEDFFTSEGSNASIAEFAEQSRVSAGRGAGQPGTGAGAGASRGPAGAQSEQPFKEPGAAQGQSGATIGRATAPQQGAGAGEIDMEGATVPGSPDEQREKRLFEAPPFNNNLINLKSKYFQSTPVAGVLGRTGMTYFPMNYFDADAITTAETLFGATADAALFNEYKVAPKRMAVTSKAVTYYTQFLQNLLAGFNEASVNYQNFLTEQQFPESTINTVFNTRRNITSRIRKHLDQIDRWNSNPEILRQPYQSS